MCPRNPGASGSAHALTPGGARSCRAAAAQYRLANDPQYRLADDPQYRLADNARDRIADEARYRTIHHGNQGGSARLQAPLPLKHPTARANAARATRYGTIIRTAAQAEGIEPELLHAVVAAESGYDPAARSEKGAVGLMQLMPDTAARYGVTNPRDPEQNLNAGARHLRYLLGKFDNDMQLALAAYNAGEQAVWQHGNRVPPYPETRAYVQRVLAHYQQHVLSSLLPGAL